MPNPETTDIPLMGAAYNALVENCVHQQDSEAWVEGARVLKALGERLGIEPEGDVARVLENFDD